MARKFQIADGLRHYEGWTPLDQETPHKTQLKVEGFEGSENRVGIVPKESKKSRKSSK
jgi:hypothetical protein